MHAWIVAASVMALMPAGASAEEKGRGFDDAVISELVESALDGDRTLRQAHIQVRTQGRVVYLRGSTASLTQADRAGALARAVDGVREVRNEIRVASRPDRA